jgi:hypothetical protein
MFRRLILSAFLLCCFVSATDAQVPGFSVRGQLIPNGFPAAGMAVRLFSAAYGPSAYTYSGGDGMYYLYNIPQGEYLVEVLGQPRASINVFPPYTDIPRIFVP